jgi:hypothetical protein
MNTILKTKRGTTVRIFYRELTADERERELASLERREQELSYDDKAARIRQQAADDAAGYREQRRFDAGRPATEE